LPDGRHRTAAGGIYGRLALAEDVKTARSSFSRKPPRLARQDSPLFERALVLVRFDHVARRIVNTNHSIV
jgi:hypothetical protein